MSTEIITKKYYLALVTGKLRNVKFSDDTFCVKEAHILYENIARLLTELSEMSSWLKKFNFFAHRDSIVTVFTNIYICGISFATRFIMLKKKKSPPLMIYLGLSNAKFQLKE